MNGEIYSPAALRAALGKPPATWPAAVERKLRPIFLKARVRLPLTMEECQTLALYFIYPHVCHWVNRMRPPDVASPYAKACPLDDATRPFGPFEVPTGFSSGELGDFCGRRLSLHPWALQVSLFWNEAPGSDLCSQRDCSWRVYLAIVKNESVRKRWSRIQPERPPRVREAWNRVADRIETVVDRARANPQEPPLALALQGIAPAHLASLLLHLNNVLDGWTRLQRHRPAEDVARTDRVVKAISSVLAQYYWSGWECPTEAHASEVQGFIDLLEALDPDDRHRSRAVIARLRQPFLDLAVQEEILDYIQTTVFKLRDVGLPPGDPLDDPVVQDLFWERVGSTPDPDRNQPHELRDWCERRWQPVDTPGGPLPAWRM
jgi:hypothetical protein